PLGQSLRVGRSDCGVFDPFDHIGHCSARRCRPGRTICTEARLRFSTVLFVVYAATAADTWIDEYAAEAEAANRSCTAQEKTACRDHLARLAELLDGRADVVYRLAKAEAALGNWAAALRGLDTFSKMGLPFANPVADAAFAPLREKPEFTAIVA